MILSADAAGGFHDGFSSVGAFFKFVDECGGAVVAGVGKLAEGLGDGGGAAAYPFHRFFRGDLIAVLHKRLVGDDPHDDPEPAFGGGEEG